MKTVTIPTIGSDPYKITINGYTYSYKAGSTVSVPDEVAAAIENAVRLFPAEVPPVDGSVFTLDGNAGTWDVAKGVDSAPTAGSAFTVSSGGVYQAIEDAKVTAEQLKSATEDVLEDHPEWTTTVEDGSLTESKFDDDLKVNTIKDYVTPQMYGAKGDGVTDDSEAFQSALTYAQANSVTMLIPKGEYVIESPMEADTSPFRIIGQPSFTTNGESIITCSNGFITSSNGVAQNIENIALVGDGTGTAIAISGRWFVLRNIHIRKFETGISCSSSPYSLIDSVEINTCDTGISITPTGTTIQNCHIHGCTDYGIITNNGNALNITGIIEEDNDTHIKINSTDYVVITNSYIGDNSDTWLNNNGGTNVVIDNLMQSVGGPHEVLAQSSGSLKITGKLYSVRDGINITGGTVDLTDMKIYLERYLVSNTGGTVIADESKYQNGYLLSGASADYGTDFKGAITQNGVNYAGSPCYDLNSEQNPSHPDVHAYVPGIVYKFKFPDYMVGKTVYLTLSCAINISTFDIRFNNAEFATLSSFLLETINKISDYRGRLNKNYTGWNIPIIISDNDVDVLLFGYNLIGTARDAIATINYIFASYDNGIYIPMQWDEVVSQ